ncbi:MAG: tyrosine-type recombinase/integrase, partial [Acidimicrobiia bacterium]
NLLHTNEQIIRGWVREGIRLHDLRHTWATLALQQGVPLKVVSERLGHSSIAITADTYQHVTEGMDRDAAERVAQVLFR